MKYQCPCCGCFTYSVPPEKDHGYICPVCFWENDRRIGLGKEKSSSNHGLTLAEARENYRRIGACEEAMREHVRPPKADEIRKGLIIGASSEALHTIEMAHRHGISVVAMDGNPKAEGLQAADQAMVVNISDETATVNAARGAEPEFVLTVPIGRYLTTIGAVNDALQIPGISREMAVLCTDKYAFHECLRKEGLRNCHCYLVSGSEKKEEPLSFPAILKPRYGSGSREIHFLENAGELQAVYETLQKENLPEDYVLEECVAGEEYGVDGAVIDGRFYQILLRKKENTPPPARQAVGYYSVQPADPFFGQVREYLEKVIACMGLAECLFHADLIRAEQGPFIIELSARPSGHNLHNLFTPLCTGIDVAEEYIKYRLGQPYSFEPKETRSMMIHYFDMEGEIFHVPDFEEVQRIAGGMLIEWKCNICKGDVLLPVSDGHSVMGRGYFVLEEMADRKEKKDAEETEAEFKKKAESIKALFLK